MTAYTIPIWGWCLYDAGCFGWRYAAHIGPWLVFFGKVQP